MWFEARKQEKKIRVMMIDHKKRAERRKQFYEKIKQDPSQFMQIHGRSVKIHMDPVIAKQADSTATMRPWQGDSAVLIDRFDVRSHLDLIPEIKVDPDPAPTIEDNWEERQCNYERYRILVANEFTKVSETKFLKEIWLEENYGYQGHSLAKAEEEKKKVSAAKKASIGYVYEDGTVVHKDSDSDAEVNTKPQLNSSNKKGSKPEEVEDEEEDVDLDVNLDVTALSKEDGSELNTVGTKYYLAPGDYLKMLWQDRDEQEQMKLMRDEEDEKGKKTRRERKIIKEQRLRERGYVNSPLSYIQPERPNEVELLRSSSSSSRSPTPKNAVEYITSFGGEEDSKRDSMGKRNSPVLPQDQHSSQPISSDRSARYKVGKSDRSRVRNSRTPPKRDRSRSRSRRRSAKRDDRSHRRQRSRSSSRRKYSRRSRSRHDSRERRRSPYDRRRRRSRSRSYRKRSKSPRRSYRRSRSTDDRLNYKRSSDRQQKRSRRSPSVERRRKSRSRDRKISPPVNGNTIQRTTEAVVNKSPTREQSASRPSSTTSDSRQRSSSRCSSISRLSLMSIRSSMSESEKERLEVENRRRRLKRLKKGIKPSGNLPRLISKKKSPTRNAPVQPTTDAENKVVRLTPAERLKLARQKALKKTYVADKREEIEKKEQKLKEELDREEELNRLSMELRRKERERRRKERKERGLSTDSSSSSGSDHRRIRRSRTRSLSSSSPPAKRKDKEREKSPVTKLVNY